MLIKSFNCRVRVYNFSLTDEPRVFRSLLYLYARPQLHIMFALNIQNGIQNTKNASSSNFEKIPVTCSMITVGMLEML